MDVYAAGLEKKRGRRVDLTVHAGGDATTARLKESLASDGSVRGSVGGAARVIGVAPSTVKRHLADLRARTGLTTEQLIYAGQAAGWLVLPELEPARST